MPSDEDIRSMGKHVGAWILCGSFVSLIIFAQMYRYDLLRESENSKKIIQPIECCTCITTIEGETDDG